MMRFESLPITARVVERLQESADIFTLRLALQGSVPFHFAPGQFNMVNWPGLGEAAISIVSDPENQDYFDHTVRVVGRVTTGLSRLQAGDTLGIRGPFGRGWPLSEASDKNIVIVTGGLGCAPVVALINYLFRRRQQFGHITLLQGVKHHHDLIWRQRYAQWAEQSATTVALAADNPGDDHSLFAGNVVQLFERVSFNPENSLAMLCGPEIMMHFSVEALRKLGFEPEQIWLSLERNMHCGNGLCGHCQMGPKFLCKDGPVFRFDEIEPWFYREGF